MKPFDLSRLGTRGLCFFCCGASDPSSDSPPSEYSSPSSLSAIFATELAGSPAAAALGDVAGVAFLAIADAAAAFSLAGAVAAAVPREVAGAALLADAGAAAASSSDSPSSRRPPRFRGG